MTSVHIEKLTTSIEEVHTDDEHFARLFAEHMARWQRLRQDHEMRRRIAEDEARLSSVVERQRDRRGRGWTEDD